MSLYFVASIFIAINVAGLLMGGYGAFFDTDASLRLKFWGGIFILVGSLGLTVLILKPSNPFLS